MASQNSGTHRSEMSFTNDYVLKYFSHWCRTKEMLRLYCEEAKSYGDVPLPIGLPARQITVVLNPASNGGCCT